MLLAGPVERKVSYLDFQLVNVTVIYRFSQAKSEAPVTFEATAE